MTKALAGVGIKKYAAKITMEENNIDASIHKPFCNRCWHMWVYIMGMVLFLLLDTHASTDANSLLRSIDPQSRNYPHAAKPRDWLLRAKVSFRTVSVQVAVSDFFEWPRLLRCFTLGPPTVVTVGGGGVKELTTCAIWYLMRSLYLAQVLVRQLQTHGVNPVEFCGSAREVSTASFLE